MQGPLAKARVAGSFTGHYVAREDGRVERGTEHGSFKGIADLTNDLIRVRVKAEETVVTGKGEYSLIVTTAG